MLDGFKKFILRGNVVDMAVGVVIGAAFASVVGGLTSAFLNPLIKLATGGGEKFSSMEFTIHQRLHRVFSDRGCGLVLRGATRERPGGADEPGREAA
jgi:large conductance mechanosensitive channel protein